MGIATEQARAVEQAPPGWVVADTTPLMTAVYSHMLFDDDSLYPMALAHQALYDSTLVTGLDLPWVADGLQRDGPHAREPVDAPEGTAARPMIPDSSSTSHSTVGLPRESMTSRPMMSTIVLMAVRFPRRRSC
jgi:hypothetical protein